ncbi:GNAT family N-acetyltransferase [Lacrimispora sp. 38-1]|uniref:GNAT family N-acetyltransferase n=1 Tax=Lacrimispora sp. 38-1 TaxID=3125778 RepID=UPI003CE7753A
MSEKIENNIKVMEADIHSDESVSLLSELSRSLNLITGNSGEASFSVNDMEDEKSTFVIAKNGNKPAGCGAIRRIDDSTAELKRMYAKEKGKGIGSFILNFLENKAGEFGYSRLICETRKINTGACSFYMRNGFCIIPNYGKYQGRVDAVCFEKRIK